MAEPRRSRFTLIELLVVIAIIAILASMLLPSLSKAKERATSATCMANLKQLSFGCQAYLDDSDGWYPAIYCYWPLGTSGASASSLWWWYDFTFPYVNSYETYLCPVKPRPVFGYTYMRPVGLANPFYCSYACPSVGTDINNTGVAPYGVFYLPSGHVSKYPEPHNTIELTDSKSAELRSTTTPAEMFYGISALSVSRKHLGGANYAFADGHAGWYYNPKPGMWTSRPGD